MITLNFQFYITIIPSIINACVIVKTSFLAQITEGRLAYGPNTIIALCVLKLDQIKLIMIMNNSLWSKHQAIKKFQQNFIHQIKHNNTKLWGLSIGISNYIKEGKKMKGKYF